MRRLASAVLPFILRAALLAGLAALPGCAILRAPQAVDVDYFTLDAVPGETAAGGSGRLTLEVSPARDFPGFDSARMVYVKRPSELDYFARNRWVDTPARMLTPLLVQALERSGAFRAVVRGSGPVTAQLRLDSEVVRLQQEFLHKPSRVRLTVRVQLIDLAGRRVLGSREFDVSEPAPSDDPYGGVIAANQVLRRVLGEVVEFCRARAASASALGQSMP